MKIDYDAHMALSNKAAKNYDKNYSKDNVYTTQYLYYEEDVLKKLINNFKNADLAIDLGCGTGRSIEIYKNKFKKVYGWDFSKEMTKICEEKFKNDNNVIIQNRNIEIDYFKGLELNSIDFINASFGFGSFIFDINKFLDTAKKYLKENGKILITFYNKNSTIKDIETETFAAKLNSDNDGLIVNFGKGKCLIPCVSYNFEEIKNIVSNYFKIEKSESYSSLLQFFTEEELSNNKTLETVKYLENNIKNRDLGFYILIIAEKIN